MKRQSYWELCRSCCRDKRGHLAECERERPCVNDDLCIFVCKNVVDMAQDIFEELLKD